MLFEISEERSIDCTVTPFKGSVNNIPTTFARVNMHRFATETDFKANRPKGMKPRRKIVVVGLSNLELTKVLEHFHGFGKILRIDYLQDTNYAIIKYSYHEEAKSALKKYKPFLLDTGNGDKMIGADFYYPDNTSFKIKEKQNSAPTEVKEPKSSTIKLPRISYLEWIIDLLTF